MSRTVPDPETNDEGSAGALPPGLPEGLEHVRTTDLFDESSHPAGLRRAHRVAEGVWGRLVVQRGTLTFVFEDQPDDPLTVDAGGSVVIPPMRLHHVDLAGPVAFVLEFYRPRSVQTPEPGEESTGLRP